MGGDLGEVNKEQKESLDTVYHGSKRLVRLVNDLLNVSRLESGRLKIEPKPHQLEALIDDAINEVGPLAEKKSCKVTFHKPEKKLPELPLDEGLFHQVIHNLLTNAIKYSSEDSPTVDISIKGVDDMYEISVVDNGIGIPQLSQAKLFEKFYRAENATLKSTDGTGMGLYLAKMILTSAGGSINFTSEENVGTTFNVCIPQTGMIAKSGEKGLA
ncbi:MAG: sensor histidine kinase [Patescibacteria group bacterium]